MNSHQTRGACRLGDCIKMLAVIAIVAFSTSSVAAQKEEPITITERHTSLMNTVDKAEKSGELTLKEATSLRSTDAKICAREVKMKSKNGGKLSYANIATIESELNKISNRLHKLQLTKRIVTK